MKRPVYLLFSCIFLFFASNSSAQLRTAIIGGPQLSSVPGNSNPGWDTVSYKFSSRQGYQFGILADMPLSPRSPLFLQSGMSFSNKGHKFSSQYDSSNSVTSVLSQQFVNYMQIPLNLVLKLKIGKKSRIMIGGGPYLAFLYNGTERKTTNYSNGSVQMAENKNLKVATSQGKYNNFEYGVNGLFGFEFGRIILTANYSQGLSDFYKPANVTGDYKHQVMGATLGFYLNNPPRKAAKPKEKKVKAQKDDNAQIEQQEKMLKQQKEEELKKEQQEKQLKEEKEEIAAKEKKGKKAKTAKIKDKDKDGIPDDVDGCPTVKGDSTAAGCPDADGDGVADKDDKCPGFKGSAKYNGCPPPDTDKDGVNDEEDRCPDIPGSVKYGGCPIPDTDGDGINDEEDKCPTVSGSKKYGGCPIPDTDKDGVNDDEDRCPTVKGLKSNNGCPEVNKEIVKKVQNAARRIQFNYKSTTLTQKSKVVLNSVVKILKDNPELRVFIEGYTSKDGNPKNHMRLSKARAEAVRKYFISKGIDPERLKAEGFGAANQLNSGRTEYLLSLSRRVELKLTNN